MLPAADNLWLRNKRHLRQSMFHLKLCLSSTQIKWRIYCNTLDSSRLVNTYWAIVLNVKLNVKNINNKRYIIILNPGQKFPQDFCKGGQKLSHHFTTLDESSPYNCYPRQRFPGHSFPYNYQQSTVHSTILIHWIKLDDVISNHV